MQKTLILRYVVVMAKKMNVHQAIHVKEFPDTHFLLKIVIKPVNQKTIVVLDEELVFYKVVDFCFGFEVGHEGLNF